MCDLPPSCLLLVVYLDETPLVAVTGAVYYSPYRLAATMLRRPWPQQRGRGADVSAMPWTPVVSASCAATFAAAPSASPAPTCSPCRAPSRRGRVSGEVRLRGFWGTASSASRRAAIVAGPAGPSRTARSSSGRRQPKRQRTSRLRPSRRSATIELATGAPSGRPSASSRAKNASTGVAPGAGKLTTMLAMPEGCASSQTDSGAAS
jgi:hypothetical protein